MGRNSEPLVLLVLCCFVTSCERDLVGWRLSFVEPGLQVQARVLHAEVRRGECAAPGDVLVRVPPFEPGEQGSLPSDFVPAPGHAYALRAWAVDASCHRFAEGCTFVPSWPPEERTIETRLASIAPVDECPGGDCEQGMCNAPTGACDGGVAECGDLLAFADAEIAGSYGGEGTASCDTFRAPCGAGAVGGEVFLGLAVPVGGRYGFRLAEPDDATLSIFRGGPSCQLGGEPALGCTPPSDVAIGDQFEVGETIVLVIDSATGPVGPWRILASTPAD